MPYIVTSVHDPVTLAATCRRLGLHPPTEGCVHLDNIEASGLVVHLTGLHAPIVVNTLTGLIGYHPRDNAFVPYRSIMRFILRYYEINDAQRRGNNRVVTRRPHDQQRRHFVRR